MGLMMMRRYGEIESGVGGMKEGGSDYIWKGVEGEELVKKMKEGIDEEKSGRERGKEKKGGERGDGFVEGESEEGGKL